MTKDLNQRKISIFNGDFLSGNLIFGLGIL